MPTGYTRQPGIPGVPIKAEELVKISILCSPSSLSTCHFLGARIRNSVLPWLSWRLLGASPGGLSFAFGNGSSVGARKDSGSAAPPLTQHKQKTVCLAGLRFRQAGDRVG
jgi:hypothetical protein